MRFLTSLLFFILIAFCVSAQRTVDITIITHATDTIRSKAIVVTNLFDKTLINELSFDKSIRLKNENGRYSIKIRDVKYFEFVDFRNKKRVFVSKVLVPELKFDNRLYEKIVTGKLNWYRSYYKHAYDGSIMLTDHFFIEGHSPVEVGVFNSLKKNLRELMADRQDLLPKIENIKTGDLENRDNGIFELISEYNKI